MQVRPISPEGFERLEHREGGMHPLWVKETQPGIYTSAWMIQNKHVLQAIRSGKKVMTIVIDTNVPGHPSISVAVQPIVLEKG